MLRTLAGWCVRHRRLVVLIWFVVLVGASLLGKSVGSAYSNSFQLPHTQSTDAIALLQSAAPKNAGDTENIVVATSGGAKLTDPAIAARVDDLIKKVETLPHVVNVTPYTSALGAKHINADQTIGFIPVALNQQLNALTQPEGKTFVNAATSTAGGGLHVSVSGQLGELSNKQALGNGTLLGVILALIVLLLVFGSVYAAILPLMSALFALGTAIGLIEWLSHALKMPQFAPILVALIGLGVGVDYALFIVTRHRQGLVAGRDVQSSIINAVNTSGRAVLFAGIIVCIALLGMFALGVSFLYGLAVAAAIGVAFTMIAALTLLPAMLGFIGPKVMSRKQKKNLAQNGPRVVGADSKGFWPKWADRVQRVPVVSAVLALVVIGVLAAPFFSLRLGSSDQGNDPVGTTTRTAYDLLAKGFGQGFNGPLQLVSVVHTAADKTVIAHVANEVTQQPDVASVTHATVHTEQDRGRGGPGPGLSEVSTAGRGHDQSDLPPPRHHHPPGRGRLRGKGPGGRDHCHLRRLCQCLDVQTSAVHRAGRPDVVHPLGHCLPQFRHSVDRGGDEHPLHRRRLRDTRGRLPVGLRRIDHWHQSNRTG